MNREVSTSAQVLPRAALSPASQSQQRDALRGGGLCGLMGDPRFPSPTAPAAAEGSPVPLSILHFFRKAARTSIKRSKYASIIETSYSSRGPEAQSPTGTADTGKVGGSSRVQAESELGGRRRPTPRAPLSAAALMQTRHPPQNNYPYGGSQGLGWDRAPIFMVTVLLVLLERVLGPSPLEGSRGSLHRPQSQQSAQVSPASPTSTPTLPDLPQLPSS